eukprot:CAMPEP_0197467328 /NCGR_PEP_ID=MMETSP1175-20131217/65512_1 /TAXON_ID=1003142 /ORGANISM="Triceratium dubium, Strain CCMP147" /LENGTH=888 /DNA_ID=CAMNT_0043003397 /DNA_START=303 /DNA_END=2969 /DNA_ORIENTATION=+
MSGRSTVNLLEDMTKPSPSPQKQQTTSETCGNNIYSSKNNNGNSNDDIDNRNDDDDDDAYGTDEYDTDTNYECINNTNGDGAFVPARLLAPCAEVFNDDVGAKDGSGMNAEEEEDDDEAFQNHYNKKRPAKDEGDSDDDHDEDVKDHPVAKHARLPPAPTSVIAAAAQQMTDSIVCPYCQQEAHAPVRSCATARTWVHKQDTLLFTISSGILQHCMDEFVDQVRGRLIGPNYYDDEDRELAQEDVLHEAIILCRRGEWDWNRIQLAHYNRLYQGNNRQAAADGGLDAAGRDGDAREGHDDNEQRRRAVEFERLVQEQQRLAEEPDQNAVHDISGDEESDNEVDPEEGVPLDQLFVVPPASRHPPPHPPGRRLPPAAAGAPTAAVGTQEEGDGRKIAAARTTENNDNNNNNDNDDTQPVLPHPRANNIPAATALPASVAVDKEKPVSYSCEICFDDFPTEENMLALECGHSFCKNCWHGFVEQIVGGNHQTVMSATCPAQQCRALVDRRIIQAIGDPNFLPRFDQHQLDSFVQGNRRMVRWCPGPDCQCAAILPPDDFFPDDEGENNITGGEATGGRGRYFLCGSCRTEFCFYCGLAPHGGTDCRQNVAAANDDDAAATAAAAEAAAHAAAAAAEAMDREATRQLTSTRDDKKRKECPNCKVMIEKLGGCNRMVCKCSHSFCWLCLGDYSHYGGHFCGRLEVEAVTITPGDYRGRGVSVDLDLLRDVARKYKNADAQVVSQELIALDQYNHAYRRYLAHGQGQRFAEQQCPCLRDRAENYMEMTGMHLKAEVDFIRSANETLVASRRLLKYAYCSVYHSKRIDEKDTDHTHLGFMHLQRLEQYTEELSGRSEGALTRPDRKKVLDLIAVVKQCMEALKDFEAIEDHMAG